jgi:hypothetical protein
MAMQKFQGKIFRVLILFSGLVLMAFFQNCAKAFKIPSASTDDGSVYCDIPASAPSTLSGTCLSQYSSSAKNFKTYDVQYPLYSDGAKKKRWIYLPSGTQINTLDPDNWSFPTGTILWKEFSLSNTKLETRQMEKISAADGATSWRFSVYAWKTDQSGAVLIDNTFDASLDAANFYAVTALNTSYQVLRPNQCVQCHQGTRDAPQGFDYLQLSSGSLSFNLNQLKSAGFLSHPPASLDTIVGPTLAQNAIGYMQSNCATCHNGSGAPNNFRHLSTATSLAAENFFAAAGNNPSLIVGHTPASSRIYVRMTADTMPPRSAVPLRITDPAGTQIFVDWINSL